MFVDFSVSSGMYCIESRKWRKKTMIYNEKGKRVSDEKDI